MAVIFAVTMNDKPVGYTDGRSKASRRRWIMRNVLSTHMGEWSKFADGSFEYATTIGQYYKFVPVKTDRNGNQIKD